MKRTLFLLICLMAFGVSRLQAQEAKNYFVQMPDSLLPLLTDVNRADFVDFMESRMKAEVTNRLEGKSEMTALTADFLSIRTSAQSTWQMKLLPKADGGKLICTVSTVCGPACDSHIAFYTTAWEPLPDTAYLSSLPTTDDFIAEASDTTNLHVYQTVRREADPPLMKADLSATDLTLTFTFTTPDYMEKEAAEKLQPFLRRPLVYRWEGGIFIMKNEEL